MHVAALGMHERRNRNEYPRQYDGTEPKLLGNPGLGGTQATVTKRGQRVDLVVDLTEQRRRCRPSVALQDVLNSAGLRVPLTAAQTVASLR